MNLFPIDPPLLNTACPWATSLADLQELYDSPHTGAVTTRTSLLDGFDHDARHHQYTFFDPSWPNSKEPASPSSSSSTANANSNAKLPETTRETATLNTLGYSPIRLQEYLGYIQHISDNIISKGPAQEAATKRQQKKKPFIISVTGTASQVAQCYVLIAQAQQSVAMPLAMEINLSCPNIPGKSPAAYEGGQLREYLMAVKAVIGEVEEKKMGMGRVAVGVKTPPYTYAGQFETLVGALIESARGDGTDISTGGGDATTSSDDATATTTTTTTTATSPTAPSSCPISFITTTNTLGSSLLLTPQFLPNNDNNSNNNPPTFHHTLNSATGTGIGGMAGAAIHPLALGNVYTLKQMLSHHKELLGHVVVIGVGGVSDGMGFARMRAVGAVAVGVASALGGRGVGIFGEILGV